jgi:glyoxylase-like metal-dependent hydrolase (beta-lactamase superfamily II)
MQFTKLVFSAIFLFAMQAKASAPKQTTGNPGYYRFSLGDFEVNVISDGTLELPFNHLLAKVTPKEIKADFDKNFLSEKYETSVDAFLINTGSQLVLVDTGAGTTFSPTLGKLQEHLKAAGYKPEQIDAVVITHMHGDHVGGLAVDGKAVFKNAILYVDKADVDYWTDKAEMEKAPKEMKGFFEVATKALEPYIKSGHLKAITADTEIVPGIHSIAAHGHTPGHTIYSAESKGQKMLFLGDMIHVAAVQFEKPTVTLQFDSDQDMAQKQRLKTFAAAAKEGDLISAAHLPFPGVGHLRAEKKGYTFVPINYTR